MTTSTRPIWRRFPLTTIMIVSLTAGRFLSAGVPPRLLWQLVLAPGYLWSAFSSRLARPFRPPPTPLGDFFYFVLWTCAYLAPIFILDLLIQRAQRALDDRAERRAAGRSGQASLAR